MNVLILGGYGFFGNRIAASLSRDEDLRLIIAGRHPERARATIEAMGSPQVRAIALDAQAGDLAGTLDELDIATLVHTAGPFQGQDYAVANAAIDAGCNYIDLADAREFVAGIRTLDDAARARGVSVISGASSLPALSSAVVDRLAADFARIDSIEIGISSGARAPGLATVKGVFGYCGKPIRRWEDGGWRTTTGWMDLRRYRFPDPVGVRYLGSCDVPDLDLFPDRYSPVSTVKFHAGFASAAGHLIVWALAGLVRLGVLRGMNELAGPMNRASRMLEPFVSDKGAMYVRLCGSAPGGGALTREWKLVACRNHGPHIPCGAAIALVRKLARGADLPRGAMPCMGLLSVEEYLAPLRDLDIREIAT